MEQISEQQLLDDLKRVTNLIGHPPSYEDMRKHGIYGCRTYQRRLGPGWEDVKRHVGWKPPLEEFEEIPIDPVDGAWLSGITDGEGCLRIQKPSPNGGNGLSKSYSPAYDITLRSDDEFMVLEIHRILGSKCHILLDNRKSPSHKSMKNANPAYKIMIRDIATLAYRLIPILEKYPLRSKKRYELPVLKLAVNCLLQKRLKIRGNRRYTDDERDLLERCYLALHELKQFNNVPQDIYKKYNLLL
jgi:hypothetical protein